MLAETLSEFTPKGVDKIKRYGWAVSSVPGEFRLINKRLLNVNREVYQRDAYQTKCLEMASNWSWISCGALVVAEREGKYWVVDGQHRKLAADRRSDITDLPCMVFSVRDVKDEARAFLSTNTNRKAVTALGKFRALVAAGDDAAIKVQEAINAANLRIATASKEARDFKAVAMALKLAAEDYDAFLTIILLCGELAYESKSPVHARMLSGLYYINRRIEIDQKLRKRIKQVGAANLLEGAHKAAAYHGHAGACVCAAGMLQVINHGLHTKYRLGDDA